MEAERYLSNGDCDFVAVARALFHALAPRRVDAAIRGGEIAARVL